MNGRGHVHHIDLTVREPERSRPFYEAVLGFMGDGYYAVFFTDPDGLKIEYVFE